MLFNSLPHNLQRPWERSLLKRLWEKEKLLLTSIFSFSNNVFYPIKTESIILATSYLSFANALNLVQSKKMLFRKELKNVKKLVPLFFCIELKGFVTLSQTTNLGKPKILSSVKELNILSLWYGKLVLNVLTLGNLMILWLRGNIYKRRKCFFSFLLYISCS